jgi:protein gp37
MAKDSAIEWTDATWNPWMGCTKVSEGCKNCYMFREQQRYGHDPTVLRSSKTTFRDPLKWKEPKMIFVCSWSDFFHEDVPERWRKDAMDIIYYCPQHTFLLLTKRPEVVRKYVMDDWWYVCKNAWLGVTVENQNHVNRLSELYDIPASMKFLSAEPLLGPLDLSEHMGFIDWVIAGGESGPDFREMKEEWATDLRDQCVDAGVPFFFKQWSGLRPKKDPRGMVLDGQEWKETP